MRTRIPHRPLLLIALAAALAAAQEPAAPPPAVAGAVDALQKEIGRGYAAYRSAVKKAEERAGKDLQKAMVEATRRGDLETATAIKAALDELNAGTLRESLEAKVRPDIDLLGEAPPAEDALRATLAKGGWVLERGDTRNLIAFAGWTRPDGAGGGHWSCTAAPDVSITLLSGVRLRFRSASLSIDTEFVSDAKGERLGAANGWAIRALAAGENAPPALDAPEDPGMRRPGGRRR